MKTNRPKIRPLRKVKHASLLPAVDGVLAEALLRFMEYHPAARVTCNLRKMMFEFLMSEAAIENIYLKDLLYDLDGLFDLLDEIQAHEKE